MTAEEVSQHPVSIQVVGQWSMLEAPSFLKAGRCAHLTTVPLTCMRLYALQAADSLQHTTLDTLPHSLHLFNGTNRSLLTAEGRPEPQLLIISQWISLKEPEARVTRVTLSPRSDAGATVWSAGGSLPEMSGSKRLSCEALPPHSDMWRLLSPFYR